METVVSKTGIRLTPNAAIEIKKLMATAENNDNDVLRISVKGGGCAGFSYEMKFDKKQEGDICYTSHEISIVTDLMSELYLNGLEIDFGTGLSARGFIYNNPNAQKTCGCGESFS